MGQNLETTYNPKAIEEKLYQKWCDNKYFHAEVDRDKKPFTIVMPPPNITGKLHMGHALDNTLQDILIRYKRMQGYNALWVPGTDHAAISTEVKVTEQLKAEGIDKKELGREGFLARTWEWKEEYGGSYDNELSFYCGTGWRATIPFLIAYQDGKEDISLFDGGWWQWTVMNGEDPEGYPIQKITPEEAAK